ncbi:hypothetical protein A2U01_0062888, partial [Trifolium medium]|nr:hypothetical protein [Trifolium medium]
MNRIPDPPEEEGFYRAPSVGPNVSLMGSVEQPTKDDCQDFSLDGGKNCSWSSSRVKLFRLSRIRDMPEGARVLEWRST